MGPEAGITETLQRKDARLDDGSQEEASVSLHLGLGRMESPVSQIDERSLLGKSRGLLLPTFVSLLQSTGSPASSCFLHRAFLVTQGGLPLNTD